MSAGTGNRGLSACLRAPREQPQPRIGDTGFQSTERRSAIFLIPLSAAVCATLALQWPAYRYGLAARPCGRKTLEGHGPLISGIAIFIGLLAGLPATNLDWPHSAAPLGGATILLLCGIYDDLHDPH